MTVPLLFRILPSETLTQILHYFPRKQLVKRYSLVHSSFFRVANSLPNLHIISDDNIRFLPHVEYSFYRRENEFKTQSFQCIVLSIADSSSRFGRMMDKIRPYRLEIITANKLVKNMPRWYVRFPSFEIRGIPDEALLKFLQQTKLNFSNCRLSFKVHPELSFVINMEFVQKLQELMTDVFLDAREIFSHVRPEKFLKLNAVKNCDKLTMAVSNRVSFPGEPLIRQSTDAFMEWLEWKQNKPVSRRHLVIFALHLAQELVDGLKQAFKSATKTLNYVVTFLDGAMGVLCKDLAEFELENESTGERLSLFRHQTNFRLWRRIVTPNDSTWLAALTLIRLTPIRPYFNEIVHTGEIPHTEGIDKTFYDYQNPVYGYISSSQLFH
ncbi:hypothetical protein Ddc_18145 [Ditylenchus destructor]|nr:hypothetical protein Ddc_18145 [Ditylenchus destructor]